MFESEVPRLTRPLTSTPVLISRNLFSVDTILPEISPTYSFNRHLFDVPLLARRCSGPLGYIRERNQQQIHFLWILHSRRVCQLLLLYNKLPPDLSGIK